MSTVLVSEWLVGFKVENTRSTLNRIAHSFKVTTASMCTHGGDLLIVLRRARPKEGWRTSSGAAMRPTQGLPGAGTSIARARVRLQRAGVRSGEPQWSRRSLLCSVIALAYAASRRREPGFHDMKGAALKHGIPPTVTAFSLSAPSDGGGLSRIILRI